MSGRSEKEQFWRMVLEEHARSGLPAREFCRRESISEPSFYAWRRKIRERDTEARVGRELMPVTVVESGTNSRLSCVESRSDRESTVGNCDAERRRVAGCRVLLGRVDSTRVGGLATFRSGGRVMLNLASGTRIYFAVGATDIRKGFNGLQGLVTGVLEQDPLSGHLFLFVNRRRDKLKILYWDGDGLAIWYRRLEQGTFQLPSVKADQKCAEIRSDELAMLLWGIDLSSVKRRKRYSLAS